MSPMQKLAGLRRQWSEGAGADPLLSDKDDVDEDARVHDPNLERRRRWLDMCRSTVLSRRSILEAILLGFIVWLALARRASTEKSREEVAGDVTGVFPKFSQKIVTFQHDPDFVPEDGRKFFTNETKQKWLDLVPQGLGWIIVDHPQQYHSLPEPINGFGGPDQSVFTTSVTHQLHCLYGIAKAYSGLKADPSRHGERMPWHVNHCFDYLRQSIMCAGDLAVEGQEKTFPDGIVGSDGWDGKHVCRDYDEIYKFLDEHRATEDHWI
ncbi:Oxidase ustYa [Colletotrichum orbiculare MAFF 240422]|uniref:Oxidase ustYa n=1 Tax=Colletotrichum orbiculare (strain 104-T / ATCC 96160 / CBS 514.97 / LARS 414 / MAFF 240422) TaxID=1213857 RepID=N4UQZ2_COLOR|nr:Oxidase ustYa [Colletotrichum orbiculare MAFF 240422]